VSVPAGNGGGAFASARRLNVPHGWHAEVWALVAAARFMTWTPQGSLLVSVPSAGQVVELTPRADRAAPPHQRVIISGLTNPQGLAFDSLDGRTVLYVAESDAIDRYVWRGSAVGTRTVLASGLPDADPRGDDVHRLKSLVVGPDHRIYVNIGSAFNASPIDQAGNPPRASVISFSSSGGDMRVQATGVRNGEGLSFAPDGVLWTAINERDQIPFPSHSSFAGHADAYGQIIPAYVTSHPPDEIVPLSGERNVGWPFCNPAPNATFGDMHLQDDEQNNPGGSKLDCNRLQPIQRGLPAHSAPLGFHFLTGTRLPAALRDGAVVAAHGSWDAQPPRPPMVWWLPWSSTGRTLGAARPLVSGFQEPDGSRWGRAVDAVAGPDGALYVSDDTAGAIYRLMPPRDG
jgi:glucose/arabinose dehydrogenase